MLGPVSARAPVGRDRVSIEIEDVLVDLGPGTGPRHHAVTFRVSAFARVLVVMDKVVVDQHLIRIHDSPAGRIAFGRVVGTRIVVHYNPRAAPTGDLHVGNFDVDAPRDVNAVLECRLIPEIGTVEPEARDAVVVVRGAVGDAIDREEVGRAVSVLAVPKHGSLRMRSPGFTR